MNKLITPDLTVAELLTEYPQLEEKLIEIAPVFSKLKNPVLRKTIAKVTSLKQASVVGGVDIGEMINKLREAAGQDKMMMESFSKKVDAGAPSWVNEYKIIEEYDATIDLNSGAHPVAKVTKAAEKLNEKESFVLITPFIPAPLIEILRNKGFETYTEERTIGFFSTYISNK